MSFVKKETAICGHNAVLALLEENPLRINRILFEAQNANRKLHLLQNQAKKQKIHCQQVDEKVLLKYHNRHQGVVALLHERPLDAWEDLFRDLAMNHTGPCGVVIPSNVEDPRNLGACIRSAVALGAKAMLLPHKGGCGLTAAVSKTASGALEKLSICRPQALERAIDDLKSAGFKVYALEDLPEATWIEETPLAEKAIWITGGEDKGVPPYLMKKADHCVKIPMNPEAHSFNTSVALSLGLYEWQRSLKFTKLKEGA